MPDGEGTNRVCILMGVYNGAADLPEQLESFAAQDHGDWHLIASDDGSTDGSVAILRDYAKAQAAEGRQVQIVEGPCRHFAANFLSLLARVPEMMNWVALSDQDDVWLPDRLTRGMRALSRYSRNEPALYCSCTLVVDQHLQNPKRSRYFGKPPGFRNALVQNIAAGNTILLNRAAADLARAAAPEAARVPELLAHDWWLYQLITGVGGHVVSDPTPTLLYRQHPGNQIGANDGWRARSVRIRMLFSGRFAAWNSANAAALEQSRARLSPASRETLAGFSELRTRSLPGRLRGFSRLRLYRQTLFGQAAMWAAVLTNRL